MTKQPDPRIELANWFAGQARQLSAVFERLAEPAVASDYIDALVTIDGPRIETILDGINALQLINPWINHKWWLHNLRYTTVSFKVPAQSSYLPLWEEMTPEQRLQMSMCAKKHDGFGSNRWLPVWQDQDLTKFIGNREVVEPGPYLDCLNFNGLLRQGWIEKMIEVNVPDPSNGPDLPIKLIPPVDRPPLPPFPRG
jgi:hypothetical protein